MPENSLIGAHNLIMESRGKLVLSGVLEVVSFEEDNVELKTTSGNLTVRGEQMRMENYNSETGDLEVSGNVYALVYTNDSSNAKGGFIKRIFK
jgi:sporulation protein YabP